MPLYEYKCGQCGNKFEKLVTVSAAETVPECPICGSKESEKLFSAFSANVGQGGLTKTSGSDCGSCGSRFT